MSANLKIKIEVAGRSYPLQISVEEEEVLRRAGKSVNDTIKDLEQKYHVSDRQDALAMCALQMASMLEMKQSQSHQTSDFFVQKIGEMKQRIDLFLDNSH